jgi:hypothetical protein
MDCPKDPINKAKNTVSAAKEIIFWEMSKYGRSNCIRNLKVQKYVKNARNLHKY